MLDVCPLLLFLLVLGLLPVVAWFVWLLHLVGYRDLNTVAGCVPSVVAVACACPCCAPCCCFDFLCVCFWLGGFPSGWSAFF